MNQKTISIILGLITVLCWGSLATFSNLLTHLPPFYVLGVVFIIGSTFSWIKPREMFGDWKALLWGAMGYFGYHFFLFYSFRHAPAIEANLINYLWPVIMVLLTPVFFPKDKIKFYHLLGGALSIIGCVVLVFGDGFHVQKENLFGYLLAFGAAVTWPIYSLGKKKMAATPIWAIGGFCFVSGILCFLTHWYLGPVVVLDFRDAWKLLIMGLGPFGIAFYSWDLALKKGDVRVIGSLSYLTPVISTLGLIFFVGLELSLTTFIAMLLIITGASTGFLDFFPSKS